MADSSRDKKLAQEGIVEMTLKNGLKVCLKKTNFEEDQVVFQLFAMGGFASLCPHDRPSAILAPDIVWESGLNNQTADQLYNDLYERSIEIETKIQPFDRQIEVSCPTEELGTCFNLAKLLFTAPKFEKEGLTRALAQCKESLQTKPCEAELAARDIFLKINTQNWDVFEPLMIANLGKVDLKKAKKFYKQSFSNPAHFTCVIVGDFDLEEIKPLIEKYLGSIPAKTKQGLINPSFPEFPKGVTKRELHGFKRYLKPLTRITFPIPVEITDKETASLEIICTLIKNRITGALREKYDSKKKLEVGFEFPFFPQLNQCWLTLQFSSQPDEIQTITDQILAILKQLKEKGPTEEDLTTLQEVFQEEESEILEENTYVLSLITNYYRAQWNIENLASYKKLSAPLEKEVLKNQLNLYLKLDQYSVISLYP